MPLTVSTAPAGRVWRIGFAPDPWRWSDWTWSHDGRFGGRWDDATGNFRTLYVGESVTACLVEVLAPLRPDPVLADQLDLIEVDPDDETAFPTLEAGVVDMSWIEARRAGSAQLEGRYCAVTEVETVAALRPRFVASAMRLGRPDFDVSVLKDGAMRGITQAVSTFVYETTDLDGIEFASRLGDGLRLWAIYERPGDPGVSPRLTERRVFELSPSAAELREAFSVLGLRWSTASYEDRGEPLPLALVEVTDPPEALAERFFGEQGITPASPLGAAILWQLLLDDPAENIVELQTISADRSAWDDYAQAAEILEGLSVTTKPIVDLAHPDDLAHIKFVRYEGSRGANVVAAGPLRDVWILTLVRDEGAGWWRVWGLSHDHVPSADDVFGD